jgi:hypothetical protein
MYAAGSSSLRSTTRWGLSPGFVVRAGGGCPQVEENALKKMCKKCRRTINRHDHKIDYTSEYHERRKKETYPFRMIFIIITYHQPVFYYIS